MNDEALDQLIAQVYRSASGNQSWSIALECLRVVMRARVVTLHGIRKDNPSVVFSFEVGDLSPQAALDFIRHYHQIEPRTPLLVYEPVGHIMSCHRHFSDEFVAQDRYHQEFLIPYGLRYCSAMKVYEDEQLFVICAIHRGVGTLPLSDAEEDVLRRLSRHICQALSMYFGLKARAEPVSVGLKTLHRLPLPVLLLDECRRIVFSNDRARALITSSSVLYDHHGMLCGPDAQADAQLLLALRELALSNVAGLGSAESTPFDRCLVRIANRHGDWVGLHCHALRTAETMSAFGHKDLAMVLLHEPGTFASPDAFVVASMWDLSPAEAQVMVGLGAGLTAQDIARQRGVALATIRAQIQAVMVKTGARRQAELVRMLTSMPPTLSSPPGAQEPTDDRSRI